MTLHLWACDPMEADVDDDGLSFGPTLEHRRIVVEQDGQQSALAQKRGDDYRERAAHDGRIGFYGLARNDRKSRRGYCNSMRATIIIKWQSKRDEQQRLELVATCLTTSTVLQDGNTPHGRRAIP